MEMMIRLLAFVGLGLNMYQYIIMFSKAVELCDSRWKGRIRGHSMPQLEWEKEWGKKETQTAMQCLGAS